MKYKQKGSALAISLVLLAAITLISLTSMQRSGLQSKIVSNLQHHELAFQTTLNEQEYWWSQLQDSNVRGVLIPQAQNASTYDAATNQITYSAIPLNDASGFNNGSTAAIRRNMIQASSLVIIPHEKGNIALSESGEVNAVVIAKLQMASSSNGGSPNLIANQISGLTVDILDNSKNAL